MASLLDLSPILSGLPIPAWRAFAQIGSTNDEALRWAEAGAADLSLVLAEEQTAGRGRLGRSWYTPSGAALAVSLILRPRPAEQRWPARLTALAALALVQVIRAQAPSLEVGIKWPNDVLVNEKKVAGVLVEALWQGDQPQAFILGMGVNVLKAARPPLSEQAFPATTLEDEMGEPPGRDRLLRAWLEALLSWRARLGEPTFLQAWEQAMLWRGRMLEVQSGDGQTLTGRWIGLEADGRLRLQTAEGIHSLPFGEVQLRPHPS
ncbi:MAG: biotin--[acetyl-CoA-carboxylase] ligase [Anaerolineales bacterium]